MRPEVSSEWSVRDPWTTPGRQHYPFIRPSNANAFFVTIVVKAPVVQLISILMGIGMVALEFPAPQLKGTSIQRNFTVKIVLLLMQAFFAILFYQVCHQYSCASFDALIA